MPGPAELGLHQDGVDAGEVKRFDGLLNRPSSINDEAIARLPQVPVNMSLDAVPTVEEVQKAIHQLSSRKASSQLKSSRRVVQP